jgi:hypothetical protein
MLKPGYEEKQV